MSHISLAGCIIKDTENKVLLIHRNTSKRTHWEIPGGKIEKGETAAAAARREIQEELGVEVSISSQAGDCIFDEDDYTLQYTWFNAIIAGGTPTIQEPHLHDKLQYFTKAELEAIHAELSPNAQAYVAKCL